MKCLSNKPDEQLVIWLIALLKEWNKKEKIYSYLNNRIKHDIMLRIVYESMMEVKTPFLSGENDFALIKKIFRIVLPVIYLHIAQSFFLSSERWPCGLTLAETTN